MSILAMSSTSITNINDGEKGDTGTSVTRVVPQYYLSTSNTSLVDGSWSETKPEVTSGTHLWTREATTLSDGTTVYSNPTYDATITNLVFDVNQLNNEITSKVSEDDFHTLITEDSTIQTISSNASTALQTANGLTTKVSNVESVLEISADGSIIDTLEEDISTIEQTANKINLVVQSGDSLSSLVLTDEAIEAVAENMIIKDETGSSTVISGGKLTIGQTIKEDIASVALENSLIATTQIIDGVSTLIFDNSSSNQAGGWVFFNNLKTHVDYFSISIPNSYFVNGTTYIVVRNNMSYCVWFNYIENKWYSKLANMSGILVEWSWANNTDMILGEYNKKANGSFTYTQYAPAKLYSDIKPVVMLRNWGVDGEIIEVTTIDGNHLETGTVTANALAADAITSRNYSYTSGYFSDAGTFLNLSNGLFRSKNFLIDANGNARFSGYIIASDGMIGGWEINDNQLFKVIEDNDIYYKAFIQGLVTSPSNIAFGVGTGGNLASLTYPFRVNYDGSLIASNATITGNITANTLTAKAGTIGGFTISSTSNTGTTANGGHAATNSLYGHSVSGDYEYETGIKVDGVAGNVAFYVRRIDKGAAWSSGSYIFYVTQNGGIYAQKGTIGGFTLTSDLLHSTITDSNNIQHQIYLQNAGTGTDTNRTALVIRNKPSASTTWENYPFILRYNGALTTTNITATGGKIGGWTISSTQIYKSFIVSDVDYRPILNGPASIVTPSNTIAFCVATKESSATTWTYPFRVNYDGSIVCTKATITGKITANSGTIGGFNIVNSATNAGKSTANDGHCYTRSLYGHSGDGTYEYEVGMKSDATSTSGSTNLAFYVKRIAKNADWSTAVNIFFVTHAGALYASNATITGTITSSNLTATGGTIGGFTLSGGKLYTNGHSGMTTSVNGVLLSSDGISLGSGGKFRVTNAGVLTATDVNISGTVSTNNLTATGGTISGGKIGGFTITTSAIYKGTNSLTSTTAGIYVGTDGIRCLYDTGSATKYSTTIKNGLINTNRLYVEDNAAQTGWLSGVVMDQLSSCKLFVGCRKVVSGSLTQTSSGFTVEILNEGESCTGIVEVSGQLKVIKDVVGQHGTLSVQGASTLAGAVTAKAGISVTGGYVNVTRTNASDAQVNVTNTVRDGRFVAAAGGRLGIYDNTNKVWMILSETNQSVSIPHPLSVSGLLTIPTGIKGLDGITYLGLGSHSTDGTRVAALIADISSSTYRFRVKGQWGTTGSTYTWKTCWSGSASDIRLKKNLKECTVDALSLIEKIKMYSFEWQYDSTRQKIGMIADELEELDERLTLGGGYDEDGSMDVKEINTFYLMGYVVKAIQELKEEIDKLK